MEKTKQNTNIIDKLTYEYALKMYAPFKKEEKKYEKILHIDSFYVVRFDGRHMTRNYRLKGTAINKSFFDTMKETFKEFCKSKPNIIMAYSFSDEISILLKGSTKKETIHSRMEKILSLYASEISLLFYQNAQKNNLELKNLCIFDARLIEVKNNQILPYFCARQAFAMDKYIMQLKGEYGIDYKERKCKNVLKILLEKGKKYSKLPKEYRYGLFYFQNRNIESFNLFTNPNKINVLIDTSVH